MDQLNKRVFFIQTLISPSIPQFGQFFPSATYHLCTKKKMKLACSLIQRRDDHEQQSFTAPHSRNLQYLLPPVESHQHCCRVRQAPSSIVAATCSLTALLQLDRVRGFELPQASHTAACNCRCIFLMRRQGPAASACYRACWLLRLLAAACCVELKLPL